ncbi:MAG: FkbM family methyltransferase [Verrucomicrobiales bacterium]
MTFLESKVHKIWQILFCIRKYGFKNALLMNVLVGSTSCERNVRFKSGGGEVPFTFRGKLDLGVLSHFTKEGFYIEDSEERRITTILDAGANIGDETARFRIHYPEADIIAVEADPSNYEVLARNCEGSSRVLPVLGALWDHDTELSLSRAENGRPESSSVEQREGGVRVKAYSIPTLMKMRGWDHIDILKLDIEGAEHPLFSGDTSWISCVNALIFEIPDSDHPGTTQLIFEKIKDWKWNGMSCGECLVLTRDELPWTGRRVIGIHSGPVA